MKFSTEEKLDIIRKVEREVDAVFGRESSGDTHSVTDWGAYFDDLETGRPQPVSYYTTRERWPF